VNFGVSEAFSPFAEIVEGEVERMENGAAYGWNLGVGSAKPGLDVGCLHRGSAHGEISLEQFRNSRRLFESIERCRFL
jgi:hypothetical protein